MTMLATGTVKEVGCGSFEPMTMLCDKTSGIGGLPPTDDFYNNDSDNDSDIEYVLVARKRAWIPEPVFAFFARLFPTGLTRQPWRWVFTAPVEDTED